MIAPVFDEVVHAPNRLRICALLATAGSAEFGTVRDALGVADSVTSKQLKILADAGYVTISKPTGKGRVKTWVTLTSAGRKAFSGHLQALQEMAATTTPTVTDQESPRYAGPVSGGGGSRGSRR